MRISKTAIVTTTCSLILSLASSASAQGSKADYQRADALPANWNTLVRNNDVRVKWLSPTYPVYQYDLEDGSSQWRTVDLESGTITPAFDTDKLASQLKTQGFSDPPRIIWFDSTDEHIIFMLQDDPRLWSMDHSASNLYALPADELPDGIGIKHTPVDRTTGGGPPTSIFVINATPNTVRFQWLNFAAGSQTYATLKPGESHTQGTYTNHAWRVLDESDQTLGTYLATEDPGVIIARTHKLQLTSTPEPSSQPEPISQPTQPTQPTHPNASPDNRFSIKLIDNQITLTDHQTDYHTNQHTTLTNDANSTITYSNFIWSPDSTRFIATRTERAPGRTVTIVESTPDDRTPDTLQPELISFDYLKPGDQIDQPKPVLFDAINAQQIEIDNSPIDLTWWIDRYQWSPDSSAFYYLYNERGHQTLKVVRVDASTGSSAGSSVGSSTVIVNETHEAFIDYSSKTYLNILHDRNELIWMSERSGFNHLYRFNATTGELINPITTGDWLVRSVEQVSQDGQQLTLRVMGYHKDQDPYHIHYARVNIDGSGFTMLTDGDGTHRIWQEPIGNFYIDSYSRVDLPQVTELRRVSDGTLIAELARGDWSELIADGWNPPQRFVAKGRDGETDIWGFIQRPTNFDPSASYPVIESIYAGPHGHHVPKAFSVWRASRAMSELGFVTVHIDGMGTNWRSRAFHDVAWKNLKDAGFPDRIAWMKSAAVDRPWMDLSRVGIYGVSAGGQNAMGALLWHNDFYKAAVADCGCHDNRMDKIWWNEQWMGYPIDESYSDSSNRDNAHLLEGNLLLTVGEIDQNVDPASTMQVADALIKADKDFEFIVFPGLGHGTIGSPYGKRRMRDFFVRALHGVEPRWEE
jgi:dipeptidyl-peptidase 4